MKSIGTLIRDVRTQKKISRKKLEKLTKIKAEFIEHIEDENWDSLPEYPVTVGFIKNIVSYLGIDENKALALLRRDYPQKSLKINPNPDVSDNLVWGPKMTFFLGVFLTVFVIVGYLLFQYYNFVRPPFLEVTTPQEEAVVTESRVIVEGKSDSDASLTVNNQPVIVSDDGSFRTDISIYEGTKELIFVAKSRAGKETVLIRKIKPEVKN